MPITEAPGWPVLSRRSAISLMYRHNASSGFFFASSFASSINNQFLRYFLPEYGKAVFLFYRPPSSQNGVAVCLIVRVEKGIQVQDNEPHLLGKRLRVGIGFSFHGLRRTGLRLRTTW